MRPLLTFALFSALTLSISLALTQAQGFPLDDAWIHQTYARNLGQHFEFSFIPGTPSAGSTSPLWTALLAVGYILRIDYSVWAFGLGWLLLTLNALLAYHLCLRWAAAQGTAVPWAAWLAGIFVTLEWHLVWAAASGMETLLFSALVLSALLIPVRWAWAIGLSIGLSILARPEGLLLLPFALARVGLTAPRRWVSLTGCGLGFASIFLPYLGFNLALSGALWPNTFYAKQAEYAILLTTPIWERIINLTTQPWIGAQVLLLPGLVVVVWRAVKARQWELLLATGWVLATLTAYIVRLPVTYQHGRYLIPLIPLLIPLSIVGLPAIAQWLTVAPAHPTFIWRWIAGRVWAVAFGLLSLAFVGLGAIRYQGDVRIIQTEMVATAQWVATNTPPTAIIAAHDIGALGYFGQRHILDLAGLVSPEVIPFIRDEPQLGAWLTTAQADYLMTFPGWYPILVAPLGPPIFQTNAPYSPAAGGENMALYRWPP